MLLGVSYLPSKRLACSIIGAQSFSHTMHALTPLCIFHSPLVLCVGRDGRLRRGATTKPWRGISAAVQSCSHLGALGGAGEMHQSHLVQETANSCLQSQREDHQAEVSCDAEGSQDGHSISTRSEFLPAQAVFSHFGEELFISCVTLAVGLACPVLFIAPCWRRNKLVNRMPTP
jgi:hypothetical protein